MRLVGERTIRELGSFPVGCPEVRLEEITFDSTRYRPTQFWANDGANRKLFRARRPVGTFRLAKSWFVGLPEKWNQEFLG